MNFLARINRATLLVRCMARAIFRGAADQISPDISRIIVVPSGKLGDVVCTTPVLRAIRIQLPKAHIIVAGISKLHIPLLSDSGLVDEYLDLEENGAAARVKACHAEAALVTGPSFKSIALLYLAGIPLVIAPKVTGGFSPSETRPYKILKRFVKTFPYKMGEYAPRERLKALEPLGIVSSDTKKYLGFSETASKKVKKFFIDNDIDVEKDFVVGISPSAGNKIKEWPEERFAEVVDYLTAKYQAKIIIVGGPGDKEKVEKTKSHLKSAERVLEITDWNIDELKSLVSKLHLFISVDTGPIYIAEAFGIPTIDITGPIDEHEQPPQGPIHRSVVPPHRSRPELFVLNARRYNTEEAMRQIESITVSLVEREIDLLIKDLRGQR
ncbi:MAG: glycosyltransferase family 9 protein [Patescibacteria group bacterium]